jgi:hypothetical protein
MSISYREFLNQNALREPLPETDAVTGTSGSEFYISAFPPDGAQEGSLWFNINTDDSRLYVRYDNNWIGIR